MKILIDVDIPFNGAKVREVEVYFEGVTDAHYIGGTKVYAKILEVDNVAL